MGADRISDVASLLPMIDESEMERWSMLEKLLKFLDLLNQVDSDSNKLEHALHSQFQKILDDPGLAESLLQRPKYRAQLESTSVDFKGVLTRIDESKVTKQLIKQFGRPSSG